MRKLSKNKKQTNNRKKKSKKTLKKNNKMWKSIEKKNKQQLHYIFLLCLPFSIDVIIIELYINITDLCLCKALFVSAFEYAAYHQRSQ